MILNNIYFINLATILLCMLVFIAFFVRFTYKELGGVKVGKDSLLFFDFMLFSSGWKSNIPALAMLLAIIVGNCFDYFRNHDIAVIYVNTIGVIAMFFFFIHCRVFSQVIYDGKKIQFIKELFFNYTISPSYIFLWLSRVFYILLIIYIYKSGE